MAEKSSGSSLPTPARGNAGSSAHTATLLGNKPPEETAAKG
jgi:hypothetical protein